MGRPRKVVQFTESTVAIPLSEAEVLVKAGELASLCGEIDEKKAAAAEAASASRKELRTLGNRRRVLADCVRTRTEQQPAQLQFGEDRAAKSKAH